MTTKKIQSKYHYFIVCKGGDYCHLANRVQRLSPRGYWGSGMCFIDGSFDFHLFCTAPVYKKVSAMLRRNCSSVKTTRKTKKEYDKE